MKIWKLGTAENNGMLSPKERWAYDTFMSFDGRRHLPDWEIPELIIPAGETCDKNIDAPFFPYTLPLVLSMRGADALLDLIMNDVELLPVRCDAGDYLFVNVTTILDCIDIGKSEYETFTSGEIMRFSQYWLKEDVVQGHNIFLATGRGRSAPFVSDAFKDRVEECGITGFSFTLVWDSDLGHTIRPLGVLDRVKPEATKEETVDRGEGVSNERSSVYDYVESIDAETLGEIEEAAAQAASDFEIDVSGSGKRIADQIFGVVDVLLGQHVGSDTPGLSDATIGLGCLYGEAICKGYGWSWKRFGPDAENAYIGVVSPEQNYCVIPMPYIWKILKGENIGPDGENDNTVLLLFNMLDGIDGRPGDEKMIPLQ